MQTQGLFFKPGFTGLTAFKPGTRIPGFNIWWATYKWRLVADSQIVYYKQLRGGQTWKCGWLDT